MTYLPHSPRPPATIGYWLLAVAASIFLMVGIGGVTRLTGSGLSITDWRPITGAIPPLSEAHWQGEFEKYQGSPQHRLAFPDMTVEEFKGIYWWEWIHRFWGRMIGLIFAVPLLVFWVRGMIPAGWRGRLLVIFLLGGLQGFLGWYMVKSGLVDRPSVSPYRLAAHLSLAVALYAWVFWLAIGILVDFSTHRSGGASSPRWRYVLVGFTALLLFQIAYGGFVAGTKAAMAYPTFPDLGGNLLPAAATWTEPAWRNVFENTAVVAFIHRWLGITLFGLGVVLAVCWGWGRRGVIRRLAAGLLVLLAGQVALGLFTTLAAVGHIPVGLGTAHQLNALLVLAVTLALLQASRADPR